MAKTVCQPLLRSLAAAVVALTPAAAVAQADSITLASTTSTEASGLFAHLLPQFEEKTGIEVKVVAQGTGQALETGRRGDADVLLVHAPAAEKRFVENGYGVKRHKVMYNDFILVGPGDDSAGIADAETAAEALSLIAKAAVPFTSRGDDSGTHKKELSLWESAGVEPEGRWYRETGQGMGRTLNVAAQIPAYALADRGTWISFENRGELELLFDGDPALFNPYGVILVNPEKHDHVAAEAGRTFIDWLTSDAGQEAIGAYRLRGQQLFIPNAN